MIRPAPTLEEQIAAVREERDFQERSVRWRAGRKSFSPHHHARHLACLDAAIATLEAMRLARPAGEDQPR